MEILSGLIGSTVFLLPSTGTLSGDSVSARGFCSFSCVSGGELTKNRKCVGQHFGDKMVKVILAAILERYHMEMKDNYLGPNPQMFLHAPKGVLILTPRDEKV